MNKLSIFLTIIFIAVLFSNINAQNLGFTPHISQIRIESRNNLIRLTWIDSPDAKGPVYIYRSARPFGVSVPANIRPIVVRYGAQYYIDDIDGMENVYYFIAASDAQGQPLEIIIPFINSINVINAKPDTSTVMEAQIYQGLSNLRARQDGNRVIITFDSSDRQKKAVLYRSAKPVRQSQDLFDAVMLQSGIFTQYADFPLPGSTWYYTVIFEDEISSGNMVIIPGINATTSAVFIYSERTAEDFIRYMPLPFLTIGNEMSGGFLSDVTSDMPLSAASINMLKNYQIPSKLPLETKSPRVYIVDLEAPTSGEDSALFQIIKEYFVRLDWEGVCVNLQRYLSLPRSRNVEARARFYLGQALYYTGNYKDALWEFLFYKSFSPVEAAGWIEAVLRAMVY
jgi:hypothetical protein